MHQSCDFAPVLIFYGDDESAVSLRDYRVLQKLLVVRRAHHAFQLFSDSLCAAFYFPSYGRKLNGDVAATERELQYTSEVLGLKYDKPQAADSTPKPQLKPQPVQKEVADIAL